MAGYQMVLPLLIGYIPIWWFRFLLECNFNAPDLNFASYVPSFYKEILTVWQELHSKDPSSAKEYENEIIWNKRFIKIDGKSVFYPSWHRKGIIEIGHLLNENRKFLSRSEFQLNMV